MKQLFFLLFLSQIFPFLISSILFLNRKMDTRDFYIKIIDNFNDIKLKNAPFKTKSEYLFFMAEQFFFEESKSFSLGLQYLLI